MEGLSDEASQLLARGCSTSDWVDVDDATKPAALELMALGMAWVGRPISHDSSRLMMQPYPAARAAYADAHPAARI